jgi:hypothetical protein
MDDPGLKSHVYSISGQLRYSDIEGEAQVEMISQFASPNERYFSRTFGKTGPGRAIVGSSPWREFGLSFRAEPGMTPTRLELHVHLPGKGVLELRDVRVSEGTDAGGAWMDSRTMGLIGGVYGSTLGVLGGLTGLLASRGRHPGFVRGAFVLAMILGALAAIAGVAAIVDGQPYGVWYPLVLMGLLTLVTVPIIWVTVRRVKFQQELNRMRAADAQG